MSHKNFRQLGRLGQVCDLESRVTKLVRGIAELNADLDRIQCPHWEMDLKNLDEVIQALKERGERLVRQERVDDDGCDDGG